jgi:hypothetical protein
MITLFYINFLSFRSFYYALTYTTSLYILYFPIRKEHSLFFYKQCNHVTERVFRDPGPEPDVEEADGE